MLGIAEVNRTPTSTASRASSVDRRAPAFLRTSAQHHVVGTLHARLPRPATREDRRHAPRRDMLRGIGSAGVTPSLLAFPSSPTRIHLFGGRPGGSEPPKKRRSSRLFERLALVRDGVQSRGHLLLHIRGKWRVVHLRRHRLRIGRRPAQEPGEGLGLFHALEVVQVLVDNEVGEARYGIGLVARLVPHVGRQHGALEVPRRLPAPAAEIVSGDAFTKLPAMFFTEP